ncbi:hypothetical protein DERF_011753 [Dermatophagoides farinae]|uniref:Uncharacterized protein n=1 Tax=Dermatophagoides farinae TaxID=6954 RepID=A0A922HV60_DERFA|nr:hypothetical protein DERF_011753 [Dermatophagoides farinae]
MKKNSVDLPVWYSKNSTNNNPNDDSINKKSSSSSLIIHCVKKIHHEIFFSGSNETKTMVVPNYCLVINSDDDDDDDDNVDDHTTTTCQECANNRTGIIESPRKAVIPGYNLQISGFYDYLNKWNRLINSHDSQDSQPCGHRITLIRDALESGVGLHVLIGLMFISEWVESELNSDCERELLA